MFLVWSTTPDDCAVELLGGMLGDAELLVVLSRRFLTGAGLSITAADAVAGSGVTAVSSVVSAPAVASPCCVPFTRSFSSSLSDMMFGRRLP
jgi:hypothetical protein